MTTEELTNQELIYCTLTSITGPQTNSSITGYNNRDMATLTKFQTKKKKPKQKMVDKILVFIIYCIM